MGLVHSDVISSVVSGAFEQIVHIIRGYTAIWTDVLNFRMNSGNVVIDDVTPF